MRRDWLGLFIRVVFGAAVGLGMGISLIVIDLGMSGWMILVIPTVISAIWGARTDA